MRKFLIPLLIALMVLPASAQIREKFGAMASQDPAPLVNYIPSCVATIGSGTVSQATAFTEATNVQEVWFAEKNTGRVRSINIAADTLDANILISSNVQPRSISFPTSTNTVYVVAPNTAIGQNQITEIDPVTNTILGTLVNVGNTGWYGSAYVSNNDRVWIADEQDDRIDFVNPNTRALTGSTLLGTNSPTQVVFAPCCNKVYTSNFNDGTVSVLNATSGASIGTVTLSTAAGAPAGIGYVSSTQEVWVVLGNFDDVDIIDTSTDTVVATIDMTGTVDVSGRDVGVAYYQPANEVLIGTNNGAESLIAVLEVPTRRLVGTATMPTNTSRGNLYVTQNLSVYQGLVTAVCRAQ